VNADYLEACGQPYALASIHFTSTDVATFLNVLEPASKMTFSILVERVTIRNPFFGKNNA
jgi:hypothetical protein